MWAKQPANDGDFCQRFTNMATRTSGDWSCLQRFAEGDFLAAQLQLKRWEEGVGNAGLRPNPTPAATDESQRGGPCNKSA